jgi:WD40 repeat protein
MALTGCADSPTEPSLSNNVLFAFQLIDKSPTLGWTRDVWVDEDTAYVADDEQGVTIWNVDPAAPQPVNVGSIPGKAVGLVAFSPVTRILMVQGFAQAGGISLYDMTRGRSLSALGSGGASDLDFLEPAPDTLILAEVDTDADGCQFLLFYKDSSLGYSWFDRRGAFIPSAGKLRAPLLDRQYAYLAHGQHGLTILSYSFATGNLQVNIVSNLKTPGMARDLSFNRAKDHLFVADHQSGLQIIDITDKVHPRIVGSIKPPNVDDVLKVVSLGDTALFIEQYNGVYAVDCSNPTAPRLIAWYDTPDPQNISVRESDRTVFLADLSEGLLTL